MLRINTPVGIMNAPADIAKTIARMSDAEIVNRFDTEAHVDPFILQELYNRGLYAQTADAARRAAREEANRGLFARQIMQIAAEA